MTDYNKKTLIQWAVIMAVAIVLFFSIILLYFCNAEKGLWAFPIPFAAIVYGCVVFFKKYYPKDNKEDK